MSSLHLHKCSFVLVTNPWICLLHVLCLALHPYTSFGLPLSQTGHTGYQAFFQTCLPHKVRYVACIMYFVDCKCLLYFDFFCKFPVLDGMAMAQVTPLRRTLENFFLMKLSVLLRFVAALCVRCRWTNGKTWNWRRWKLEETGRHVCSLSLSRTTPSPCHCWTSTTARQLHSTVTRYYPVDSVTSYLDYLEQGISESSSIQLITNCSWVSFS